MNAPAGLHNGNSLHRAVMGAINNIDPKRLANAGDRKWSAHDHRCIHREPYLRSLTRVGRSVHTVSWCAACGPEWLNEAWKKEQGMRGNSPTDYKIGEPVWVWNMGVPREGNVTRIESWGVQVTPSQMISSYDRPEWHGVAALYRRPEESKRLQGDMLEHADLLMRMSAAILDEALGGAG